MGSLFSSPAAAADRRQRRRFREHLGRTMSKEALANLDHGHDGRSFTVEEIYLECISWFVHGLLKHYNANNPGAEFMYPAKSTTEMKAACIGFREDFVWYHFNFSARRRDNQEKMHLFFAELCYDTDTQKVNLETCVILEKPFKNSCAFCPEESNIIHPSEAEFVCGKEGQQAEFFNMRDMLIWPWDTSTGDLDL